MAFEQTASIGVLGAAPGTFPPCSLPGTTPGEGEGCNSPESGQGPFWEIAIACDHICDPAVSSGVASFGTKDVSYRTRHTGDLNICLDWIAGKVSSSLKGQGFKQIAQS